GYLGVGLVIVAQTAMSGANGDLSNSFPSTDLLAIPLLIAFFCISGLRVVFEIPAALDANWIFRLAVINPDPPLNSIIRNLMLRIVLPWEVLVLPPLTAQKFGWTMALAHTVTVIALTVLSIDIVLVHFRKIPFTCSSQPETKQLLFRVLGSIFFVLIIVPMLAGVERWMLESPVRFVLFVGLLAIS